MKFKAGLEEGQLYPSLWKVWSIFIETGKREPGVWDRVMNIYILLWIFRVTLSIFREDITSPYNPTNYRPGRLYWMRFHFTLYRGFFEIGFKIPIWCKLKQEPIEMAFPPTGGE